MTVTEAELSPYATFHPTHLQFREDTPLEVFGKTLDRIRDLRADHRHASLAWYVGDAFLFAKSRDYFDGALRREEVGVLTGFSFETALDALHVARSYQPEERHPALTFKHHQAAVALEKPERENLLRRAEKERISAKGLRPMVRRTKDARAGKEGGDGQGVGAMVCPHCEGTGMLVRKVLVRKND